MLSVARKRAIAKSPNVRCPAYSTCHYHPAITTLSLSFFIIPNALRWLNFANVSLVVSMHEGKMHCSERVVAVQLADRKGGVMVLVFEDDVPKVCEV